MVIQFKQFLRQRCPLPAATRRLGLAGLMFFAIKGLLWLVAPLVLWAWGQ